MGPGVFLVAGGLGRLGPRRPASIQLFTPASVPPARAEAIGAASRPGASDFVPVRTSWTEWQADQPGGGRNGGASMRFRPGDNHDRCRCGTVPA